MRVQSFSAGCHDFRPRSARPVAAGSSGEVFSASYRSGKTVRTAATLVGVAGGAVALPLLTSGLTGTAGQVVGGLQGAVAGGALGALVGGFAAGRGQGFDGLAGAYGGAIVGGIIGVVGGAVTGALVGTSGLGAAFGVATGAVGGAFLGFTMGKGLTSS
ncbi:MAG: hypothetical protein HY319_18360 [Armatimonadetes bacterium]|nr:hypothetical protein [Armatimonadota bacterium]